MEENNSNLLKLINERKKKDSKKKIGLSEYQKKENVKKWTSFYRRNINLYASRHLKIRIHPFQHIMLYLMGVSQIFFAICSRGLAKTFDVALYSMCKCLIFPYSEVVLTATTIKQAEKMVREKMEVELCRKLSPILNYYYIKGLIKFSYGKDEVRVDFLMNGSWIIIAPAMEQSRGNRATLLIYEECRLLKKGIIDSVFEKMAHPRQAIFLTLPKYTGKERWIEECQSIYITSARFKSEWFWRSFKTVVNECFANKKIQYNFFAGDIFLSICHGLKTKSDYFKAKKQSGEIDFRIEDLNEMLGEAEDAFFSRESFRKNQIVKKAFMPPTSNDIASGINLENRKKQDTEKRLLWIDYAFANTTGSEANDNSVIGGLYLINDNGKFKRGSDFITTHSASDSFGMERKIRELFWDYKCDYIVLDLRNGGEVAYNNLTKEWIHPERVSIDKDSENGWNPHGFTVCNERDLHVASSQKIDDLKIRTVDQQAIPCIIPIIGTSDLNSNMWLDLQKRLRDGEIEFLLDDMEYEQAFEETNDYFSMTAEEKAKLKMPFVQTTLMIQEAVNLSQEWRDGKVKLSEPRSGTKDRIVALSYGNYIATLIENKINKDEQKEDYNDISAWSFLASL